ncbi:MAG: pantoate--beta-alanine ligase, partial [Deltaproteobacteria bacterium]|nr:pantoate--beta-alanine ligase [Deltaproteobacteria bacterium]
MELITETEKMKTWTREKRANGMKIGFVPTMGYLHQGHLSLMKYARSHCDSLVVSIFINPAQFGPTEDFKTYPQNLDRDLELMKPIPVDMVFNPAPEQIYPDGFQTYVEVAKLTRVLCGVNRPTHFQGVTTVVAKLFNIVRPHLAVFGQKDFQQLVVIQRMVKDLNMDVEVVGQPTVREEDGLAMSSRNVHLLPGERK